MTQVWRIDDVPVENNEFSVDRTESWTLRKDKFFPAAATAAAADKSTIAAESKTVVDHEQQARTYIKLKTRLHTPVANLLIDLGDDEAAKDAFLDRFCFSNDTKDLELYAHYRRYFLGQPSVSDIKSHLVKAGIRVVSSSSSIGAGSQQ